MFIIGIAGLKIAIHNRFPFVESICASYILQEKDFDFEVIASEEEIDAEKKLYPDKHSDGFIESVCIYRSIAKQLPYYNSFVLHCAAIEYDEKAYCFAAKSGTGKTTHIKLWRHLYGEKVMPINGDKPIIRCIDGEFYVCGTPWSGKEMFNRNTMVPFGGICFLSRGENNSIEKLCGFDSLNSLIPQVFLCNNEDADGLTLKLLDKLINLKPLWLLKCNMDVEAAKISHDALCGEE